MPQRFLRPGIRDSERFNSVSTAAQSLWLRLLTVVDDYGRFDGRTSVIAASCFAVWNEKNPDSRIDAQETAALCQQLENAELIEFHLSEDGKKVVQLTQWQERARGKSKWPLNPDSKPLRNPAESCGILPPSSLVPRPSPSPSPIAIMSGTPDGTSLPAKLKRFEEAKPILQLLNALTGSSFRQVDSNLGLIAARLSEPDVDAEGVKLMVQRQVAKWKTDPKMSEFLRPQTLFGKGKFDSYYAARELPINHDSNHARNGRPSAGKPHRNDTISGSAEWLRDWAAQPDATPGEPPHPLA